MTFLTTCKEPEELSKCRTDISLVHIACRSEINYSAPCQTWPEPYGEFLLSTNRYGSYEDDAGIWHLRGLVLHLTQVEILTCKGGDVLHLWLPLVSPLGA